VSALICQAIERRCLLMFDYDGYPRIVEPYCHGTTSSGAEAVRAVQVGGSSRSRGMGFGKLWIISKMKNVRIGAPFSPDDPNYNPDDSAMKSIHCRV
jgi:hypothetical protein